MSAGQPLRLTVIGCSGSYPGPHSAASCYLLETEHEGRTWRVLLDLGSGALGSLQRYVDPFDVDAVLLSHLHADHCLDMAGYYVLRRYHPTGPAHRIPVWGPFDTAQRLAEVYGLPADPGMEAEFDFRVYPQGTFTVGPLTVQAFPVAHPVPAYALRIMAGGSILTYSGDTGPCPGLYQAAERADLLLAEASFVDGDDNPPHLHLTGSEAGSVASRAAARRLVITHVPPWHDSQVALAEAKSTYDGAVELAEPGVTYVVTPG